MQHNTDVLVIGGGATGAGVAWDLALRGVRCILAEMSDLNTGTSGRYHGLLHSGARYCVRDLESAKECIEENLLLRKIAPTSIEDTGGLFVGLPEDPEDFEQKWIDGCTAAGIPFQRITPAQARQRESILSPRISKAYEVPDASCDSFDLGHMLQAGTEALGGKFLTYHRVDELIREGDKIVGARLTNLRTNEPLTISCAVVVIAAGPWSEQLGRAAGMSFKMKLSRGANLAYNVRWTNTVINRLRTPGDGDIFVPVGTVSVIGTTSVKTDDPADTRVEAWEVARILENMEPVTPGISQARILRAWSGVRPLYDPGGGDQRSAARTFQVLDGAADGVEGVVAIIGGKLTTYRLMAEKTADLVCRKLGVAKPSSTASTPLPTHSPRLHELKGRLDALEHGDKLGMLICECEIVSSEEIKQALATGAVNTLNDLRRDLRVGMGPCQGGFCAYRAAALRHETLKDTPDHTQHLLTEFVERRFAGVKPLLWGHNLRQALLAEHLYSRIVTITPPPPLPPDPKDTATFAAIQQRAMQRALSNGDMTPQETGQGSAIKIIVVGAGLAGLTAAIVASERGARVEIVADGQGALPLFPGWFESGDVDTLRQNPAHPYARAGDALNVGIAALARALDDISPGPFDAVTATGRLRAVDFAAGAPLYHLTREDRALIVGIRGWRDFFAGFVADALNGQGYQAQAAYINLPDMGGNFDTWAQDFAHFIDSDDGLQMLTAQVKPLVRDVTCVGFPAVLGFEQRTLVRIVEALGVPIFEIPTLPPSIPGMRLYRRLRSVLLDRGVRLTIGPPVSRLHVVEGHVRGVELETAANGRARTVYGDAVILATGGLFGGGLHSDVQGKITEMTHNLEVVNVPPLDEWFSEAFLSGQPQPIHYAGLLTDALLRPLTGAGEPAAPNLFAAGRLLAGYSPIVEGCTEGVDIATAAHAVMQALMMQPARAKS